MIKRSNNGFCLKTLYAIIICFFLPFTTGVKASSEEANRLETSIILLSIKTEEKTIFQDPFYELLDLGDYLLVPVNRLATQLNFEVSYQRNEDKVVLTNKSNQKQAEVYLKEEIYRIDGQLLLFSEPPLFIGNDLFVSIPFLESFLTAKINWDFRYQELTLNVEEALLKERPAETRTEKREQEKEEDPLPQEGPPFALSSIRYEFGLEHREEGDSQTLDGFIKLRADGYAGDWAISAAGTADYDFYHQTLKPDLPLLRAKYHKDNELIIIGNTDINLEKTIEEKELWGILYMTPDHHFHGEFIAYTDVSGPAASGDQVLLYVNERLWQTTHVNTDGQYLFLNVPLRINRVNQIRVAVQKADGKILESTQEIAASPRLIKKDRNELLATAGLYKHADLAEWEGVMVGYRQRKATNENVTISQETMISAPFVVDPRQSFIGADTGVAFRLNKNLVCTLDWLIGGELRTDVQSGIESSILYCLENGYFEGIVFYIPTQVREGVSIQPGQGTKVFSELEFTEDLMLNTEGYLLNSTPEATPWSLDGAKLTLTKRFGKYDQNSLSGSIGKEWQMEHGKEGIFEAEETNATVKYALRNQAVGTNTKAEIVATEFLLNDQGPYLLHELDVETDFTFSLARNFLFGVALDTVNTWQEQIYDGLSLTGETNAKWNVTKDTLLIGNVTLQGCNYPQLDASFQTEKLATGLSLQHFFSPALYLFTQANRILERPFQNEDQQYLYTTAYLGVNYHAIDGNRKISGSIGYRSPVGARKSPQWSYGLSFQKFLKDHFLLKVKLERLYDALWDQNPEHIIGLSVSRALGYAEGKAKAFRYTDEDNTARISGVVYLDINANGRFDEGDKPLPAMKILVDGRIATTNEAGEYVFSSLPAGIYRVDFHLPSLPANYTPATGPQLIRLREQENIFLDFGVTINGSLSGKVFIDTNDNGQQDPDEEVLPWVGVILDHGQQKVFTGSDGSFYFEGVSLGAHTLTLDPQSLPTGLKPAGHEIKTITLTEEELDITEIQIPLVVSE